GRSSKRRRRAHLPRANNWPGAGSPQPGIRDVAGPGIAVKLAVTTLAFCVAALLALGMVMLYSSSMAQVGARYLVLQLVWCGLGLVLCLVAAALDYRWLKKLAWPLLVFAVLLLVAVLITPKIKGARRWF